MAPVSARADEIRNKQWHLKFLDIPKAHAISKGKGVTVAVVDTGVDRHPDLRKNLLPGANVLAGGKGNGQLDENGHGTSMAGLIAGHGRTGTDGVLGVAPEARILPVKDQGSGNKGDSGTIAAGIDWAAHNGAKVINVSSSAAPSRSLNEAVATAAAFDAVVVAGSGNRPAFFRIGYPAAVPGVLAVGAVDRSGKHASFSVEGAPIQICAPGVSLETTRLKGSYSTSTGTSPATAIVSGAAALVRAKFPDLTAQQVIRRLTATATDIGPPGRDDECGFGLLNIVGALTADVPDDGGIAAGVSATPTPNSTTASSAPVAAPKPERSSVNVPAVFGGLGVVLLAGGLVAFLLVRRRRKS